MSKAWIKRDKESAKVGSKTDLQLRKRVCFHLFHPMTCQLFRPIDSVIDSSSKRSQAAMPSVQSNFEKAPTSKQARKISENTCLSTDHTTHTFKMQKKPSQKKMSWYPSLTYHNFPWPSCFTFKPSICFTPSAAHSNIPSGGANQPPLSFCLGNLALGKVFEPPFWGG